jgi:phosphoglycerol transferase MdoB-like AlkP superfamily enzyme
MTETSTEGTNRRRTPIQIATLLMCPLAFLLIVGGMDPWLASDSPLRLLVLNTFPVVLLFALFLGLIGRLVPALALCTALIITLFYVNGVKLDELQQPLTSTDFLLWRQVFEGSALLTRYGNAAAMAMAAGLTIFLVVTAWPFEPVRLGRRSRQVITAVSALLLLSLMSLPAHRLYADTGALNTPWHPLASVRNTGLIASLVSSIRSDFYALPPPDPARANQLREQLAAIAPPEREPAATPVPGDVIIVLSESFFDPGILAGVDTCQVLPDWCALAERGISGALEVPTFGGNTTRTEFEVLTGIPYRILPAGIYPYQSVVTRPTLSLAWLFRQQGYRTLALHPHLGSFWQRDRAMPLLGFDDFLSQRDMPRHERSGFYISDRTMTDQIIEALQAPDERPLFLFAISMENHGPWSSYRPNMDQERLATLPGIEGLSEGAQREWRAWLYHARNALSQLERLVAFLDGRDRPAHVLFFGDHLPGLHQVFEQVTFTDERPAFQQSTPFLLLGPRITEPAWQPVRAHQLSDWLISSLALDSPAIYRNLAQAHALEFKGFEFLEPDGNLDPLYLELLYFKLDN